MRTVMKPLASITPSIEEVRAGSFSEETIKSAIASFRKDGALLLDNVIDRSLVENARHTLMSRYAPYLDVDAPRDALRTGERRHMITIRLEPPFNRMEFLANQWIL